MSMIINDLLTENPGKNIPITHSLGTPTFINTSFNDSKDSKKSDSENVSDRHILKIKGYLRVALDYLKKQILTDL